MSLKLILDNQWKKWPYNLFLILLIYGMASTLHVGKTPTDILIPSVVITSTKHQLALSTFFQETCYHNKEIEDLFTSSCS